MNIDTRLWGISDAGDVIDTFPSEAQARIEAYACRDMGDPTATVVHSTPGGPWLDDDGHVHDKPTGRPVDMLASPGQAAHALVWAYNMAERDTARTRWLDAITAEAISRGYDPAVLADIHADTHA